MSYDLRRLRIHGLIERIPRSRRYRVTDAGLRTALCYRRTCARVLRSALAAVLDPDPPRDSRLKRTVEVFDREFDLLWYDEPWHLRSAVRFRDDSGLRVGSVGLRVARTLNS